MNYSGFSMHISISLALPLSFATYAVFYSFEIFPLNCLFPHLAYWLGFSPPPLE